MAGHYDLRIDQGSTFRLKLTWYNPLLDDGGNPVTVGGKIQPDLESPIDLSGFSARMQVRRAPRSDTVFLELDSETIDGGLTLGDAAGTVDVLMTDEQTADIPTGGVYDLEIESQDGEVTRLLDGKVLLSAEVTRESVEP